MTGAESTSEPVGAVIPTHSRQQAMDWSLVLLSQGIESLVSTTESGWSLVVEPGDHERALETLEKYRRENRGWRWQQRLRWPEFSFHFGALLWCLVLVAFHCLPSTHLRVAGTMHSDAVLNGAWWQLFTAIALHANLGHLMGNLTTGFLLLGLAMGRYGPGGALLAAYLSGAAGNFVGVLLHAAPYRGVGASGMIMGGLGLLAVQTLAATRAGPLLTRHLVTGLFAGLMLFVLLGVDPASDVVAHVGGFLAGLLFGGLMTALSRKKAFGAKANIAAASILGLLFVITWAMALR